LCGIGFLTVLELEKGRRNPKAGTEVKIKKVLENERARYYSNESK